MRAVLCWVLLYGLGFSNGVLAQPRPVMKVAILDSFHYQKYVTTQYKLYYRRGVELAVKRASDQGVTVHYKLFQYTPSPLSIVSVVKKVKAWKPDVIMGPRDSNKFLLLPRYVHGLLTVSPFATAKAVSAMPNNFFSVALPVPYAAKAMYYFITRFYPTRKVYVISEANCKSCMDVSAAMKTLWKKKRGESLKQTLFIEGQSETVPMKQLMSGYQPGDIIFLPNMAHASAVLMTRIANELKNSAVFVGGDGWGAWRDTEVGKLLAQKPFTAFHFVPWSLDGGDDSIKQYARKYRQFFKHPPQDKLSYISYRTLSSIVDAYLQYHAKFKGSLKEVLLKSYQAALARDYYFFKPTNYRVYKITNGYHAYVGSVNIKTKGFVHRNKSVSITGGSDGA